MVERLQPRPDRRWQQSLAELFGDMSRAARVVDTRRREGVARASRIDGRRAPQSPATSDSRAFSSATHLCTEPSTASFFGRSCE